MDRTADSPLGDHALEQIAIVGMACRLPGAITSPASFWDAMVNKRSVQTPSVPKSRFNIDAFYHENLNRPGSFDARGGYFLDGSPHDFDPRFFDMSPIEAMWLDPQQRRILEVAYECLENAGITLDEVAGKNIGVFVGCFTSDYQQMLHREPDFRHEYSATGTDPGLISARVCNVFDLHGPSAVINTACSSSITAIHHACQTLRAGECDGVVAAGVNLIISVDQHLNTAKLGILSPTSTCHTFDAAADGYGRGEGAGAIYLRRLSDAVRDGNPIRAIIRGSAVNTNGKAKDQGITHPSLEGQERVLRTAYERAGLDPTETLYVECHGTGTPVGDPIEVHAIARGMNDRRSCEQPLRLGAVKANIGHSEAASGIFAVIKAAMVVESAVMPGVAGFNLLNPAIKETEWNVKINVDTTPWPECPLTRRVGVSSFGYAGTNGHLILEAGHSGHGQERSTAGYTCSCINEVLVCFTAHDRATLERNIRAHADIAERFYLPDLAYTLNCHRTHFSHRAFTIAQDSESRDFNLPAFEFGLAEAPAQIAFVFTGQGAQWLGMGRDAMCILPTFSASIRSLDKFLQNLHPPVAWSIEESLLGNIDSERLIEPDVAQALCTAVQIAIVDQLRKWGIVPSAVVGHSSGEIAAAYAAGLLSALDAFKTAFYRGLAVSQESPQGSMLAVGLGVEAIEFYVRDTDVVIACENSAESVTLSGPASAIQQAQTKLATAGVFVRELTTGRPYHSPAMNVMGPVYEQLLTEGTPENDSSATPLRLSKVPMVSSVTGLQVHETDLKPRYWVENLTSRVRFHAAVTELCTMEDLQGLNYLVEIGPHPALAGPLKQITTGNKLTSHIKYIPSFVRGSNSCNDLLRTAGRLFLAGYNVSLKDITDDLSNEQRPRLLVDLPPVSLEQREESSPRHDLLGRRVAGLSNDTCVWKNILRVRDVPWSRDHRVGKELLLPGAAYLALAIEALWQISDMQFSSKGVCLKQVSFQQGLVVPESDRGIEIVTRLLPQSQSEPGWYSFTVESHLDKHWTTHCSGYISANKRPPQGDARINDHIVETLHNRTPPSRWYLTFGRVGVDYGRSFQCLGEVRSNHRDFAAASKVALKTDCGTMTGESRYILHPGTIDTCLQLAIISFEKGRYNVMPCSTLPLRVEEMAITSPGEEEQGDAFAWTDECQSPFFRSNIQLFTARGLPILECKGVRFKEQELNLSKQLTTVIPGQQYMQTEWKPDIDYTDEILKNTPYKSLPDAVVELIRLIDHKRPVQRALLFEEDDCDLIEAVASQLPVGSLTIAETSAGKVEEGLPVARENNISIVPVSPHIAEWSSSLPTSQDLIIVRDRQSSEMTQALHAMLKPGGRLLILRNGNIPEHRCLDCSCSFFEPVLELSISGFNLLLSPELNNGESRESEKTFTIVVKENKDQFLLRELVEELDDQIETVNLEDLCDLGNVPHGRIAIFDVDGSILTDLTEAQFDVVKKLALSEGNAFIWVTFGVHQGRTVEGGLSLGFLRGIRSEHPAAQIVSLDVDWEETAPNIGRAMTAALGVAAPRSLGSETEFWLHNGVLHISRITSWACPGTSRDRQTVELPLNTPLKSEYINGVLVFKADEEVQRGLEADEMCVQVEMTEFQATQHRTEQPVIVVGRSLDNDNESTPRVVTFATQNGYSTIVRARRDACLACEDLGPALLCATLPSLCKVLISMEWLGRAQKNDHIVLLHMPLPFVQLAALLCQDLGVQLTVVVEAPEERARFHRDSLLGSVSIIVVQDPSVYCKTALVKGTGKPSLVISESLWALAREAWKCISTAGRFVLCDGEVGGTLDPTPFTRGASFLTMGYDPLALRPEGAVEVLQEGLEFIRQNKDIWPSGAQVYSIDQLPSLSSSELFVRSDNEGRAVQFRYGESTIQVQSSVSRVWLSSEAVYLLVGGLGGIGSSLARWMVERGCRHFVFVSRSGMKRPKAAETVKWIERTGASVQVFQADAGNEADMRAIVARVTKKHQIRGVVHAAMVLQDGMLHGMTTAQYSAAVTAKLKIAQVLHSVLSSTPLDFFIMTSSISATVGTPGQTNYNAGNSFLDAFARYRRSLGIPACSLALSMLLDVGVVAENESIEDYLLQLGFYGIDEIEMLEGLEIAMSPSSPSHIILGLDPCRLHQSATRMFCHGDARLRGVQRDLDLLQVSLPSAKGITGPQVTKDSQDYETWVASVGEQIMQKCADVLGRDIAEIEFERGSIASYGLDSVISVELQQWLIAEFGLELSFHAFTAPDLTFKVLTERAIRYLSGFNQT
ncbi:polyketide synthase [Aspergillus sclerotioniger CBS 115572]|uniref:Polyketide synthase n=1 Tax=Aspergillus sclerotioniger CBS 115572 TaxID=1450535 RepID=A0A317XBM6_9EURO|nr:polyketide synthase [Aspergillus sclerotioniger CBS 115572]PWY95017.1 polyketide synthase [Aspergillus sclerotioniger CBS 115572]